jgi:hypothetical protein
VHNSKRQAVKQPIIFNEDIKLNMVRSIMDAFEWVDKNQSSQQNNSLSTNSFSLFPNANRTIDPHLPKTNLHVNPVVKNNDQNQNVYEGDGDTIWINHIIK